MKVLLTLFLILLMPWQLLAEDLTSRDFAEGYYLEVGDKGAVHSLELPEKLYRTVTDAQLKDVRVFNGEGEVVPHYIRTIQTDPTSLQDEENVPFFPLYGNDNATETGGISLQVSRDSNGAVVNIQSDPFVTKLESEESGEVVDSTRSDGGKNHQIIGYLLDLSRLKKGTTRLEIEWDKKTDSSVYMVDIQQSSDLIAWRSLVYTATLADLQFGGQSVEKKSIELPKQPLKYLKLSWQENRWPLTITRIRSISQVIETRKRHNWVSLANGKTQQVDGQTLIEFTSDYRLPVSRMQIRFPGQNSMARLSLQSRPGDESSWRTRCEQVFYDLTFEGSALQNEPCKLSPTSDHLWRLVVKEDGAGLAQTGNRLSLDLGWQPSELFFISRGTPPYLLAYGSGKLIGQDAQASGGMLLQTIENEDSAKLITQARLGKSITLGGEAALLSPAKAPPWKKWLLWLVLVLGVALMALMARSLTKEMKSGEEE
ncbi:MAG: hypothetical protein ACI8ZB_002597 [Desulforhopalus sp.]|jgi:hypothetical protein